jgi:putative ABC transport system permease protein
MGRLLALADEQDGRRVCILGYDVARQLLGETLAIPTSVRIGGLAYTVVGVTRKKVHGVVFNESDDRRILIPFRAMTRDFPDDSNQHGIRASLLIQPVSVALHEELLRDIRETLAARHRFSLEDPDALVVFDTIQTARAVDGVFAGLARFGDTSSLMTVLLGSIGLTNILLTSVRERIREIGIRRSVGARNLQIFTQFLGEGLMLAATGGLAGLAAGGGLALLLGMISIPGFAAPVLRPAPALAACGIVGITGILASIYPAWKAVKIDPAEALRHA